MNRSARPFDGKRRPTQRVLGSDCTRIAEAVADGGCIWSESISVGEIGGQHESGVLAELHEKPEIVGERKLLITTRDCRLQRLLNRLLGMEPHRSV